MDKLKMHTPDKTEENFRKLSELFPNAVTETINENGEVVRAIDKEVLMQEISAEVIEGPQERYHFTWPDKKKSVLLSNSPIAKTLRLDREKSVGRDGTIGSIDSGNIYIEGDNLEALKLLQETYLEKIDIIYVDPPYNRGSDTFIYSDDYSITSNEFSELSGQYDDEGNQLFNMQENNEANGRFHTDWLNMIYPRLRVAKDLLSDNGLIFMSIGDEEIGNLRKVADEIFGSGNFRNQIAVRRGAKSVQAQFSTWDKLGKDYEHVLMYSKDSSYRFPKQEKLLEKTKEGSWNNHWRGTDRPTMRYPLFGITPETGQWRWGRERSERAINNYKRMTSELNTDTPTNEEIDIWLHNQMKDIDLLRLSESGAPEHYIPSTNKTLLNSSWMDILVGSSSEIRKLFGETLFETAKLTPFLARILNFASDSATVLDFFSGSASTAEAVFRLNAKDSGNRKFILIQIPEVTQENSLAHQKGYKDIFEFGEERIRRAGRKIKEESPLTAHELDIGYRVFRVDSSNMKDVYYSPNDLDQRQIDVFADNIKPDRTPEDLLIQVMLDLGILLSSKIEEVEIDGKKVFSVADGYLIACFDSNVTEETVTEIAKQEPFYAVFRDSGIATDSVATNFDQIFETYSPKTQRKVL